NTWSMSSFKCTCQWCLIFFVSLHFCFVLFGLVWFGLVSQDRVSLCSPGCPGTHLVDQAVLNLRNLPASASRVLGLKACATNAQLFPYIFKVTN
ncbi:mCG1042648, partial [Mus musculus]